jgi:heme oxygenase
MQHWMKVTFFWERNVSHASRNYPLPDVANGGNRIWAAPADWVSAAAKTPDIRGILRAATAASHARLHTQGGLALLLRGELTRPAYARLLLRLLGLHAQCERRLEAHRGSPLLAWQDIGQRRARSSRLRDDLRHLGVGSAEMAASESADVPLPSLDNSASALGFAWVVEGSALGGRVLARRFSAVADASWASAWSFFRPIPRQPDRWAACCAAVDECGGDVFRLEVMRVSAVETFAAFEVWLETNHS